jgi:hypothetical protein
MKSTAFFFSVLILTFCNCTEENTPALKQQLPDITCTDSCCYGTYKGPEFVNGADVAHQFSNKISSVVGDKLKELYSKNNFVKVDFDHIMMSTKGMGSGNVTYKLKIPFKKVNSKYEAFTSFDHVGGWGHKPALSARKSQLKKLLMTGDNLDISELITTSEGLEEYWIQWRHKEIQKDCNK